MIIDSHAHYSHWLYEGEFSCIDRKNDEFSLLRTDRNGMFDAMKQGGICFCIEPSTGFDRIDTQAALVKAHKDFLFLALGLHPNHSASFPWEDREKLRSLMMSQKIVAVGETGLDYFRPEEPDKFCQKQWFRFQIDLAHEMELPLILHVRDADEDAIAILRENHQKLHGGVAHCFCGDTETAMKYIELGFALGIGSRILKEDAEGEILREMVRQVPLTALLVETDAPYLRPNIDHVSGTSNQRKKARTTSLILPEVIKKIAEVRGEDRDMVEEKIYRNTLKIFKIMSQNA